MKMPTITELMKELNFFKRSIRYGDNRTIKYYFDAPVLAYGIGFNGFVCIFKTERDLIKAYSYGRSHPLTQYSQGGFAEIELNEAINVIKNNKLFARTFIDEQNFENAKTMMEKRYVRPVLGTFEAVTNYDSLERYRLVRLVNKKLRAERVVWGDKFSRTDLESTYNICINKDDKEKLYKMYYKEIKNYNMPDELLTEMKDTLLIDKI